MEWAVLGGHARKKESLPSIISKRFLALAEQTPIRVRMFF